MLAVDPLTTRSIRGPLGKEVGARQKRSVTRNVTLSSRPSSARCLLLFPRQIQIGIYLSLPSRIHSFDVCNEGTVVVRDAVVSVSGPSVTFADGHKEDFDVVISATGYFARLAFHWGVAEVCRV